MKIWPGVRVIKTFATKALKSLRSRACSRRPSDDMAIGLLAGLLRRVGMTARFLQKIRQDRSVLGKNVIETNPCFGRFPVAIEQRKHQLQGYRFIAHGIVGESAQHDLQRGQAASLTVLSDRDLLSKNVLQDCPDGSTTLGTALGIAAFPFLKLRRFRWASIADNFVRRL